MLTKSEQFLGRGSGWAFDRVNSLEIQIDNFVPISGGAYKPLPDKIKKKKAVINMENDDDECLKWSILRTIYPKKENPSRIDKELRRCVKDFNWNGITFPTDMRKGPKKFEENNPGYEICIVGYEDSRFYPMKPAKENEGDTIIDLLLFKGHYYVVKSLSRLLGKEFSEKEN